MGRAACLWVLPACSQRPAAARRAGRRAPGLPLAPGALERRSAASLTAIVQRSGRRCARVAQRPAAAGAAPRSVPERSTGRSRASWGLRCVVPATPWATAPAAVLSETVQSLGVDWGTAGSQGSKLKGAHRMPECVARAFHCTLAAPACRALVAAPPARRRRSPSPCSLSLSSHWHAKFKLQYGRRSSLKQGINLGLRMPLGRRLVLVGTAAGAVADCCGRGPRCRALAPPLLAGRARRRRFLAGEVRAEGRSFLRQPRGESRACISTLACCCPAGAGANPCPAPTAPSAPTWLPQRHTPKSSCLPRGLPGLNHRLQGARTQTSACLSGQGAC